MPPLTYIHAFEAARTTAGGRGEAMQETRQKTCVTIALFNAEYLAMSDISINTHTKEPEQAPYSSMVADLCIG